MKGIGFKWTFNCKENVSSDMFSYVHVKVLIWFRENIKWRCIGLKNLPFFRSNFHAEENYFIWQTEVQSDVLFLQTPVWELNDCIERFIYLNKANPKTVLEMYYIETKSDNICILTTSCSTSSGTFLWWLQILYDELWLNITGASVTFRAAIMVALATWDKSTSIPNRFISLITTLSRKIREDLYDNQHSS